MYKIIHWIFLQLFPCKLTWRFQFPRFVSKHTLSCHFWKLTKRGILISVQWVWKEYFPVFWCIYLKNNYKINEWLCINYLIYLIWLSYLACLYNVSVCMNKKVYYPQENLSQFDYPYQLFFMISTILVKNNPISRKHRNLCLFPCLQYRSKARPI